MNKQIQKESERFQALFSRLSDIQWGKAEITEAQTHIMQDKIDTFDAAADREHLDEQENTWLREF